ncbi:MAG: NAD(P)H-quinone oxidoreductase [Saprospiraceae bacterium]
MRAVLQKQIGGAETLYIGQTETLSAPENDEILVKVHTTALNRADILQREGKYPAPEGESQILGLEFAGEIVAIGNRVETLKVGDRVAGLVGGGSYAEFVKTHELQVFKIPDELSFVQATAIPEVFITADYCLTVLSIVDEDSKVLIHAGASGVGTAAIQLAKLYEVETIYVTASKQKHEACLALGADFAIDYKNEDFVKYIKNKTNEEGVDMILDVVGADYFQRNLDCLAVDGQMVMLAFLGGFKVPNANLIPIIAKRLMIAGVTIRNQNRFFKEARTDKLKELLPHFVRGELKPVIDSVYDWTEVQQAHEYMENNLNIGKIVLKIRD